MRTKTARLHALLNAVDAIRSTPARRLARAGIAVAFFLIAVGFFTGALLVGILTVKFILMKFLVVKILLAKAVLLKSLSVAREDAGSSERMAPGGATALPAWKTDWVSFERHRRWNHLGTYWERRKSFCAECGFHLPGHSPDCHHVFEPVREAVFHDRNGSPRREEAGTRL